MPNYRNKNKNRKNKNRNKNNNNNNQNQNKKQEQNGKEKLQDVEFFAQPHDDVDDDDDSNAGIVSKKPAAVAATQCSHDSNLMSSPESSPTSATLNESSSALNASESTEDREIGGSEAPSTSAKADIQSTVAHEKASDIESACSAEVIVQNIIRQENIQMGVSSSKVLDQSDSSPGTPVQLSKDIGSSNSMDMRPKSNSKQGKVVVHRVIQEITPTLEHEEEKLQKNILKEVQKNVKVIIHRVEVEEIQEPKLEEEAEAEGEGEEASCSGKQQYFQDDYQVESPKTVASNDNINGKITKTYEIQIQEMSDGSSSDCNDNPPLVCEVESEPDSLGLVSYGNEDATTSDDTIDEEEEEKLSATCTYEDDIKQRRVQKRVALETHFLPQLLSPRYLDSIMEENSDMSDARSDCSDNPLVRSAFGDELDETHADSDWKAKRSNAVFPKSNLDFSKKHKHGPVPKVPTLPSAIREETMAIVVETKLVDQTLAIGECCSTLAMHIVDAPETEALELVYINSASSSISDLMELDLEEASSTNIRSTVDLDTDIREIVTKPTNINATSHVASTSRSTSSRESTPVNQTSELTENKEVSELAYNTLSKLIDAANDQKQKTETMQSEEICPVQLIEDNTTERSLSSTILSSGTLARGNNKNINDSENRSEEDSSSFFTNSSDTENLTSSDSNSFRAEHIVKSADVLLENFGMNNVRKIVNTNSVASGLKDNLYEAYGEALALSVKNEVHGETGHVACDSPPPPPIPPPPQTVDISSDPLPLPVFHVGAPASHDSFKTSEMTEQLYMQTPHSHQMSSTSSLLSRQESADSHCSDSTTYSQCTAINMNSPIPKSDFDVTCSFSDTSDNWKTITDADASAGGDKNETAIKKLRLLCAETLASMPYGEEVLEELATVAQNIGEVNAQSRVGKMPYPLPNLPHINDLQVSIATESHHKPSQQTIAIRQPTVRAPPRVPEPPSKYNSWLGLPTDADPKLLVCLSPSQRTYISEKQTNASDNKPDQLLDAHQKFIERRGYHEYTIDQVNAMDSDNLEEQQILKTAALMKKLRKSLTPPPPPIPPPPVPSRSSATAAKAQNQTKAANSNHDVISRNANEQAAAAAPDTDGEENKHRLLAIIRDTNEFKQNKQEQPPPPPPKASTSSYENNSGQTSSKQGGPLQQPNTEQPPAQMSNSGCDRYSEQSQSVNKSSNVHQHKRTIVSETETSSSTAKENVEDAENYTAKFPQTDDSKMQGVDSELAKMFPNLSNIFDSDQKRFSNIETSSGSPYCSQLLNTQPKRYSNIETHSYESKKRIENGQVVYDVSNTKHESQTDGSKPSADAIAASSPAMQFPLKVDIGHHLTKNPFDNDSGTKVFGKSESDGIEKCQINPTKTSSRANEEIMSALKLNTTNCTQTAAKTTITSASTSIEQQQADNSQSKLSEKAQQERSELFKNRQERENISTFEKGISSTYDEFRQRAKAAAEAASSAPPTTPATAPASTTFSGDQLFSSHHFDHEKIFKDFDDLSKQLNMELESGKAERVQREKSASLYDLSRMQSRHKFEDFKKERHAHMKELEHEIERSMRSRQGKHLPRPETVKTTFDEPPQNNTPTMPRCFEIPIQIEDGANATNRSDHTEPNWHGTYEIPVQLESGYQVTTPETPRKFDYNDNARYRRAESMFNISDNAGSSYRRERNSSNNYDGQPNPDDWCRYASDFGSSENITRPFAREVEICYQRLRPQAIRAPRMSVSTNDLSANSVHTFDHHNAYNIRRTNAPMLSQAPVQKNCPQYLSCTSMIERDPNPTYISTTSRRGVSPAPPTPTPTSASNHYSSDVKNTAIVQDRQRRSSLPRELHERQLKYILSKEEELKTEFERLQNERRRLIDEMNRPPPPSPIQMAPPQRHMRDIYRPTPKLPTLSEDEVFRQQMAEEWLNKVAEREERRLQKIIKISKIHEDDDHKIHTIHHHHPDSSKPGISEEFLSRVKERRSKLSMPADSDWESGAESHPVAPGQSSETEDVVPVKVIEGKSEANLSQLPRHLREFAKFSNHQSEKIDGGHREVHQEEERRQEASENSVSSATKKSSIVKTVKISRQPTDATDYQPISSSSQDTTAHTTTQRAPAKHPQDLGPHSHKKAKPIINQRAPKNQNRYNHTEQLPSLSRSTDATTLPRKKVHTDVASGEVDASYSDKRQPVMRSKQTRFLLTPNRRSWSETDLLNEIDNELQLAKGFLFADEQAPSSIMFAPKFKARAPQGTGIWTPKSQTPSSSINDLSEIQPANTYPPSPPPPPKQPIWTPQPSPSTGRKEFRPVRFESPTLPRRYVIQQTNSTASDSARPPWSYTRLANGKNSFDLPSLPRSTNSCTNLSTPTTIGYGSGTSKFENHNDTTESYNHFANTTASVTDKIKTFERSASTSELYRPFGRRPVCKPNEVIYKVKHEYMSEPETENDHPKKMAHLGRRQFDGIGPVTDDGMPIVLRSEVKEPHQHEWYKRLYQTIHKQKTGGRPQYKPNGYQSEPEPNYDSDYTTVKYRTLDRRRLEPVCSSTTNIRSSAQSRQEDKLYGTMPNPIKSVQNSYKNQPGRIEDYVTGHSSVSEKERKEWWDEVMDIFNGWLKDNTPLPRIFIEFVNDGNELTHLDQTKLSSHYTEGNLSRALAKESGYTSDSNLVFRKKEVPQSSPLSPVEQKQAYKSVQSGGEPPLFGFRKPAPEKPKGFVEEFECIQITPTLTKIRVSCKAIEYTLGNSWSLTSKVEEIDDRTEPEPEPEIENETENRVTSADININMFTPFPKNLPSFIPLSQKKEPPPVPPNRKSSSSIKIETCRRVAKTPQQTSNISHRHEQCFRSPDSIVSGGSKYGTITLRKHGRREPICRSKSAGAMPTLLSTHETRSTAVDDSGRMARLYQHTHLETVSPTRRQPRTLFSLRQSSRSPVAFGRSISKERTFAEEKKRLENTLPLSRTNFEASTNILRDPSLKSPQDVKQAVRSYATCSAHERSKSVPRIRLIPNPTLNVNTTMRHTMCFPQVRPIKAVESPRTIPKNTTASTKANKPKHYSPVRSMSAKNVPKTVSTASLARTSSTFSLESATSRVFPSKNRPVHSTISTTIRSKICSKKPLKTIVKCIQTSKSDGQIGRKKGSQSDQKPNKKLNIKRNVHSPTKSVKNEKELSSHYFQEPLRVDSADGGDSLFETVRDKTTFWNDINSQHSKSLTNQRTPRLANSKYISFHKSRSLSPPARHNVAEEYNESLYKYDHNYDHESDFEESACIEDLVWQYEGRSQDPHKSQKSPKSQNIIRDIARPESPTQSSYNSRQFSPTREIRVEQTPRNMRSPSRRRIDSCRTNAKGDTSTVIRASSLSSADDRSKRGLYLCGELAHSATSLSYIERHSPTCRYRNNSERFTDLNRFYSTLERVGQLERTTSLTNFKPIRKDGDLLDFEEWRKVRLHERAEKELNYLVNKLKDDQRKKDLVFRPKDVDDIKWRKETDFGLHSKEKSVEDLRENFEKRRFLKGISDQSKLNQEYYRPYWRRNTVADLASSLEVKFNSDSLPFDVEPPKPLMVAKEQNEVHLSNRLVSTLSKQQIMKISQQLNEIYSNNSNKQGGSSGSGGGGSGVAATSEEYIVTVDHDSKPITSGSTLKVRCNSSITKEDLLGPVMRKKHEKYMSEKAKMQKNHLGKSQEHKGREMDGNSPIVLARETRGAVAAKNAELTFTQPPEIPPHPRSDESDIKKSKRSTTLLNSSLHNAPLSSTSLKHIIQIPASKPSDELKSSELQGLGIPRESKEQISQKIQYFEDRQYDEPPKTIYHAREDSSPDENEVMRLIEENMKSRNKEDFHKHKELSTSLVDLKDIFGEKTSSRVNFHSQSPPPRPPDDRQNHYNHLQQKQQQQQTLCDITEMSKTGYELDGDFGSNSSIGMYDTYYRSRSLSPQSQASSYLHRVHTGEVQKIKEKFESFGYHQQGGQGDDNFFEHRSLRKARSDPDLKTIDSEPKDASKIMINDEEHGDVPWITHKFEVHNQCKTSSTDRGRPRKRSIISPNSMRNRLMPHIDIISKTAALKKEIHKKCPTKQYSPTRSHSSSGGAGGGMVESIRSRYESPPSKYISSSNPDIRDMNAVSQHLTANWIAHKFPRIETAEKIPRKLSPHIRSNSSSPPRPTKSVQHQNHTALTSVLKPYYDDIFANQKFDPKMHQPKARYVPDGAETSEWKKVSAHPSCTGHCDVLKKSMAVTFQDYDYDYAPPVPPQPPIKGVALDQNGNCSESPNRYYESDVNIHFKTPVRNEYKNSISEEDLAIRQAEHMQKLYQEERRRKYLQELQDMNSRRHTDNFTPTQKSPIPLNRYDDFQSDLAPKSPNPVIHPKAVARALYNFQGQSARELSFRKGDVIYIRRVIDKNWYEGEHNAMIGLLPVNYIEIINKDGIRQPPRKPSEGQARAKYNFQAQSGVELSLNKGELVTLTRRVDDNWFEGKIANRKGIFPISYVEVLTDIGADTADVVITDSSTTNLRPSLDTLRTNINNEFNMLTQNGHQAPNGILKETKSIHTTDALHVDTNSEPLRYRALYKYRPQNSDELELLEGDFVHVLEKCDDGWFVGTSQRTGCFGTFPGNYVERV